MTQLQTKPQVNFKTGREYHPETAQILEQVAQEKGYQTGEWATMKQWNNTNETVRKGEKGTRISFINRKGDEVQAFLFNRAQLDQ